MTEQRWAQWSELTVVEWLALGGVLVVFGVATAGVISYRLWDAMQSRRAR